MNSAGDREPPIILHKEQGASQRHREQEVEASCSHLN